MVGRLPEDEYCAQVILTVLDYAPLLADPRLARLTAAALRDCASMAPGRLWGYVVLPETVRLIVGPTGEDALNAFVEEVKARTGERLLEAILRADDETLDMVLRYTPVWGGAIYRVWTPGYHQQLFWTEYKLSNALYQMVQAPVEAGLVERADQWSYTWVNESDS
jgi:REP element-mobilizing transposase RayT